MSLRHYASLVGVLPSCGLRRCPAASNIQDPITSRGTIAMRTLSNVLNTLAAAGLAFAVAVPAAAEWPHDKPVRFIIPAAPGGTTDGLGRIFSARLNETLNAQFLVDNRASANGVLAAEITRSATADGYTLFVPYHQHTINAALMKLPYHPVNDFTPITQLTEAGLVLVVNPSLPVKSFKEFLTWTRAQKELNFGSAGLGSGGHLAGELFNLQAGTKAQHI